MQQTLQIKFRDELISKIDQFTEEFFVTRSEFIRQAVIEKLHRLSPQTNNVQPGKIDKCMTDRQSADMREWLRVEQMKSSCRKSKTSFRGPLQVTPKHRILEKYLA